MTSPSQHLSPRLPKTLEELHAQGYTNDEEAHQQHFLRCILHVVVFGFVCIPAAVLIHRWLRPWGGPVAFFGLFAAVFYSLRRPARSRHTGKPMRSVWMPLEAGPGRFYICDDSRTYFQAQDDHD